MASDNDDSGVKENEDDDSIDDGGPAFPGCLMVPEGQYGYSNAGMSLRDWYAGQALIGLIQKISFDEDDKNGNPYHEDSLICEDSEIKQEIAKDNRDYLSETALKIADSMIEMRKIC